MKPKRCQPGFHWKLASHVGVDEFVHVNLGHVGMILLLTLSAGGWYHYQSGALGWGYPGSAGTEGFEAERWHK